MKCKFRLPAPLNPESECDMPWPGTAATNIPRDRSLYPSITIIVPSLNQGRYIEATLRSILNQRYPSLQLLIMDGGSTDSTLEILRYYDDWISAWVSEPDEGQADAIRKGLAYAKGDIVNWINADDLLPPGSLHSIADAMESGIDAVAGVTVNFSESGKQVAVLPQGITARGLVNQPFGSGTTWHQPSIWLRRKWIYDVGGIDPSLHYFMDLDLLIRYLHNRPRLAYVHRELAYFRVHEQSKTASGPSRFLRERAEIMSKLLRHPAVTALRHDLDEAYRHLSWEVSVRAILQCRDESRLARAWRIAKGVLEDPGRRWNRKSRRALRRCLLRGGHDFPAVPFQMGFDEVPKSH